MNIAIFDTEHFETTYSYIKIFDLPEHSITLIVSPKVTSVLKQMLQHPNNYKWVVIDCKKKYSYLWSIYTNCKKNKIQVLVLNTISFHHLFIGILCMMLRNTNCLLTIHDANNFFATRIAIGLKQMTRHFGKKFLLHSVKGYITLLSSTKDYIKKKHKVIKPIYCLPGGIFEGNNYTLKKKKNGRLVIAIPGSIDERRRNYKELFELVSDLEAMKKHFIFILLGTASDETGRTVIKRFKALKTEYVQIKIFETSFITQKDFDNHLSYCDIIYSPLN